MSANAVLNPLVLDTLRRWRESPLLFVTECIGATPSRQQAEALRLVPKTKRMSIRSGHGTGKDAFAAWVLIWFEATRPYAKSACTAPTARQLSDILWSEISKWLRMSKISDEFVIQKDKIFNKESSREWWIRAISPSVKASKEEQAETLAGLHGDHLLLVVDEASGVPDPMYVPLEGALTQEDNRVLLIGNMTRNTGYFYDTHFHPTLCKQWTRLHWDSRESENVSPTYCEYMATKYGIDSNVFRIRVMGDPPLEDDTSLIPLSWAEACIDNEIQIPEDSPLYLGVDVARYGDDKSIILPRQGCIISPWRTFQGMNTISLGGFINETYSDLDAEGCAVDEVGIGAGVVDWLTLHKMPGIFGINVNTSSANTKKYDRLRDELWCNMRDRCRDRQYSFPGIKLRDEPVSMGQELANELASVRYSFNKSGGYVIESKRDMRKRGVSSPNIADALGLTEYFYNVSTRVWGGKKSRKRVGKAYETDKRGGRSAQGWMSV